jgi:hypothetical protein
MATVANREANSAMAKGLGGCAAMGTFFSIIDTIRNHSLHNFTSVCLFGFACWGLFKVGTLIKQPSFGNVAQIRLTDAVVGRAFGTPAWVRPTLWVALFIVMTSLFVGLFRYRSALHLEGGRMQIAFMAVFAIYLLGCQRAERVARTYLRCWYPDQPQVAIGAEGLWITGTEIPWTSIRAIERRTRRLKVIGVDTIVVQAQATKRVEAIEIDLSDSLENAQDLYAKLRSAAAAHGANLLPEGQTLRSAQWANLRVSRERARAARQNYEDWRAKLPQEIARTEARLKEAISQIAEYEAKIRDLEAPHFQPGQSERNQMQLEQARRSLHAMVGLRDSLAKLLATQRAAWAKRR